MSYADQIRVEPNAYNMRGLIADGIEENKSIADSANSNSSNALNTANNANSRVDNIVANQGSSQSTEVIDSRHDNINNISYTALGSRLDAHSLQISQKANASDLNRKKLAYKTVSITLDQSSDMNQYDTFLTRAKAEGASIVLCILTSINNATDTTFTRVDNARITQFFTYANTRNVSISMIKPHITLNWSDGFNRATYQPSSASTFFTNWQTELMYYASICNQYNVPILSLTCEQFYQTDSQYYTNWQTIVNAIKTDYSNLKLTCAMTTGELYRIYTYYIPNSTNNIVQLLDIFGINSYLTWTNLTYTPNAPNITQNMLNQDWFYSYDGDIHLQRLDLVNATYNIPVFITECGCMPKVDGLATINATGVTNYDVQALLFKSLFDVATNSDWCVGVSIWNMQEPFKYWQDGTTTAGEQIILDYYKGGIL